VKCESPRLDRATGCTREAKWIITLRAPVTKEGIGVTKAFCTYHATRLNENDILASHPVSK
jgi:hypothetical protein